MVKIFFRLLWFLCIISNYTYIDSSPIGAIAKDTIEKTVTYVYCLLIQLGCTYSRFFAYPVKALQQDTIKTY